MENYKKYYILETAERRVKRAIFGSRVGGWGGGEGVST